MSCELILVDCFGQVVELAHSNWDKHLVYRPDMAPYHGILGQVLADPDVVLEDPRSHYWGDWHYYRWGLGRAHHEGCHLRIVVGHPVGRPAVIKTAHFVRHIRPLGRIIWTRPLMP